MSEKIVFVNNGVDNIKEFVPTFLEYKDEMGEGVQIHIIDAEKISPIQVAMNILYKIKDMQKKENHN